MFLGQRASHWPHMDHEPSIWPGGEGGVANLEGLSHQDGIPHGRIGPSGNGPGTLATTVVLQFGVGCHFLEEALR